MLDKYKIKEIAGKEYIYDTFRKKYVILTPEEWVRQQILKHLVLEKNYPPSMISVEKQIKVGNLNKRYDILIYQKEIPWMIVECKEEDETLNQHVLNQILAYNSTLRVAYLAVSNGHQLFVYHVVSNTWLHNFPEYN
jgi:hypothetical protein